ncbi:MAG: glycosyltransferase family 9 protein [Candidatus Omnitrophica bacterium]|nr:glycosyltransferase family 9 protein [Candidatus Omnitrophota bacterium]
MRKIFKDTLKKINIPVFNRFLRSMRKAYYFLLDFLGYSIFSPVLIFQRKPVLKNNGIRRILIVRNDRIGDLILSTPAIRALKETFPGAQIDLFIKQYTKDLVAGNPNVNKLIIEGKDDLVGNYDLALALHPGFKQNMLLFKSKANIRVGYAGWGGGFFLTHKVKDDRDKRIRHEVESALEITANIGAKTKDKRLEVSVLREGEEFADKFLKDNSLFGKIIVIHPGARQDYIRWEKHGFAEVADKLIIEHKVKIVLSGNESEKGLVEEVAFLMKEKPVMAVGLKLTELVSLLKRADLFIGNSTGPMHIACALGIAVVAIFGSRHALDSVQAWGPWCEKSKVVQKEVDCKKCHPTDCKDYKCIKNISSEEVYRAAVGLLGV